MPINALVSKINELAAALLIAGRRITVTGEEDTYHFYGVLTSPYGEEGLLIGYGLKRSTKIRKPSFSTVVSFKNAKRFIAFLERNGETFRCRDEDDEPLTVIISSPSEITSTNTVCNESGARDPLAFVDYERQGERFGMLTIVHRCGVQQGRRFFLVECDCGNKTHASLVGMTLGKNISCGCRRGQNQSLPLRAGQKFNQLTVLTVTNKPITAPHTSGHYYLCMCDCGETTVIPRYDLVHGIRTSCGCAFKPSLKGRVFGRLTVADEPPVNKGKSKVWKCLCQCGNIIFVRSNSLLNSKTKSCGCIKKGRKARAATVIT